MKEAIGRRGFLASSGLSVLATHAAPVAPRIIDTHVHFYDPSRPQGVPWPPPGDTLLYRTALPDAYAALVRPLGVSGTIVVEASGWLEDNQWVLDLAERHPIIAGYVGHLEPGTASFRQHLARFSKNPLFRGIRLNGSAISKGVSVPGYVADLQRLADADLVLDAIGDITMLASLVLLTGKIPQLRLVIDHLPTEPPGWQNDKSALAALRELAQRPQVYAKVSGVLKHESGRAVDDPAAYRAPLDQVWQAFGPKRVLYGSNWPVSDRIAPYAKVLGVVQNYVATKTPAAAGNFFFANAKNCYKWTARS